MKIVIEFELRSLYDSQNRDYIEILYYYVERIIDTISY